MFFSNIKASLSHVFTPCSKNFNSIFLVLVAQTFLFPKITVCAIAYFFKTLGVLGAFHRASASQLVSTIKSIVADPDPNPDPDPPDTRDFGPPESGSISQRIGCFYH